MDPRRRRTIACGMTKLPLFIALLVLTLPACELPRDPEGTYRRVHGGTLRVGIIENDPWASMAGVEAAGVEPALARRLARELEAEVQWVSGPEHELLEALKRYELDLVVGGLTRDSPWRRELAFTLVYVQAPVEVGAPPGSEAIGDINGRSVAVPAGSPVAAMTRERDATPVPMPEAQLADHDGLVAAPRWQLQGWGYVPTQVILHRERHIWALPPGENRWLVHVERFLERQRGEAEAMLQAQAEARP